MILRASLVLTLAFVGGCAATQDDASPRGATHSTAASGVAPAQLLIAADSNLTDSDANGYPDTFQVVAYLFPSPETSAQPIWVDGSFEFTLAGRDGEPIERWIFDTDASVAARLKTPVGRAQSFFLRFGGGLDKMQPTVADLRGRFVGVQGRSLDAAGATSVRLGARH